MSDLFWVIGYVLIGALALGGATGYRVANGVSLWDDPILLLTPIFWPVVVPLCLAYCVGKGVGKGVGERGKARRVQREREAHETERNDFFARRDSHD